jgi:hypothetical protein
LGFPSGSLFFRLSHQNPVCVCLPRMLAATLNDGLWWYRLFGIKIYVTRMLSETGRFCQPQRRSTSVWANVVWAELFQSDMPSGPTARAYWTEFSAASIVTFCTPSGGDKSLLVLNIELVD